ncbi:hypothetical protein D3C87_2110140 [compost metagenome]
MRRAVSIPIGADIEIDATAIGLRHADRIAAIARSVLKNILRPTLRPKDIGEF